MTARDEEMFFYKVYAKFVACVVYTSRKVVYKITKPARV